MKFGLFQSVQLPESGAQAKYYREALEQVLWAEQLGFDSVWITEHHFSRHGIVSATLAVLAYLAGVTSTIRLGTAVAVLPFHNPVQLAEEGYRGPAQQWTAGLWRRAWLPVGGVP